jgi:UDP:flavonoid glycosyltransferase YjiC (YdhE family)
MRMLFSFAGGNGHAEPLVPFADAARAAGHAVAFAGHSSVLPSLAARGFITFARGTTTATDTTDVPQEITPLLDVDMTREFEVFRDAYAGRMARRKLPWLRELRAQWSPDVIVRDEADFAAAVAAELDGIPCATGLVMAAGSIVRPDLIRANLDALRAEVGLPPDPDLDMLTRDLVLSPFPRSFRDPDFPLPPTAHSFNTLGPAPSAAEAPAWLADLPDDVPTVYFTLGTMFNTESGDLFDRVLRGLRELPVNLVVTVGRQLDPARFGPQPANVHIESYVPQSLLLPHCDLVVSHGGSGTVVGALGAGLPQVLVPMGADQPLNGERCEALGLGVCLDPVALTPDSVGSVVVSVLDSPSHRRAAGLVRDEIAALPGPEHAVPLLEAVAARVVSPT